MMFRDPQSAANSYPPVSARCVEARDALARALGPHGVDFTTGESTINGAAYLIVNDDHGRPACPVAFVPFGRHVARSGYLTVDVFEKFPLPSTDALLGRISKWLQHRRGTDE